MELTTDREIAAPKQIASSGTRASRRSSGTGKFSGLIRWR